MKMKVIAFWVLGLLAAAGSVVAQEVPLFALLWSAPDDPGRFEYETGMVRLGSSQLIMRLNASPEGRRAIVVTHPHNTIWNHPDDRCRNPDGTLDGLSASPVKNGGMFRNATGGDGLPSGFSCPWLDGWIGEEKPRSQAHVDQLVAGGVDLNYLIFDVESKPDWLKLNRDWRTAIENDPRWALARPILDSLKQAFTGDPTAVFDLSGNNGDGLAWNAYMWAQQARGLNEGIFNVFRSKWPALKGSNYEHHGRRANDTTVETYGWQFYQMAVTGTHASDSHYGWIIQAADVSIGLRGLGQNSDWLTFIFEQRKARASVRAGYPIQPWIAFTGTDFSDWRTLMRAPQQHVPNAYWIENIRHLLLLKADPLLYWNSRTYKSTNKSTDDLDAVVDGILKEVNGLIGTASPRETVDAAPLDWWGGMKNEVGLPDRLPDGSHLVATGLRHGNEVTYRVSPLRISNNPDTWPAVAIKVLRGGADTGVQFTVPAGEAGVYYTTSYEPTAPVTFEFIPDPVANKFSDLDVSGGAWIYEGSPLPRAEDQTCPVEEVPVASLYAGSWASAFLASPVQVQPGEWYTFSAYFLGRGGSTQAALKIQDANGNEIGKTKSYNREGEGWARYSVAFRATTSTITPILSAYRQYICAPALHEGVLPGRVVPGVVALPNIAEQKISLQPGWNMVALNVDPGAISPDSVLNAHQAVALVRDANGATLSTRFDINEITTWDARTAYRVLVDEPTEIVLKGRPMKMPNIELKAGWNLVPFVYDEPLDLGVVAAAYPGIILRAEDDRGNVYEPAGENVTLTSFQPGHAYRIYAAREAVLSFSP